MNIGIMTFHWAANHGAILQTYALSEYLQETYGARVQVIDYCPKHQERSLFNALSRRRPRAIAQGLKDWRKEKRLREFRKTLPLTKRFYSNQELKETDLGLDILITGSDQIWNPSFLLHGEKGICPVYYLNFGGEGTKKLSVSASFGCEKLPLNCREQVKPLLRDFADISVRENSGLDVLRSVEVSGGVVTADPTALLSGEAYRKLWEGEPIAASGGVSKMILRKQSRQTKALISQICAAYSQKPVLDLEYLSLPQWLSAIAGSKMVVTNSFHCVMMCLKLHTPFVVLLEQGRRAGMNDRFMTLLSRFDLTNRIVDSPEDLKALPAEMDFEKVDLCMEEYAQSLKGFLERNVY